MAEVTTVELEALIRRKLEFVSFCYDKAGTWRRLAQAHSEQAKQLNYELIRRKGWLSPSVDECEPVS